MDNISDDDLRLVDRASRAVVHNAKAAGVWIFGCGLQRQRSTVIATDGTIAPGPMREKKAVIGGFSIIEVNTRDDALNWAARLTHALRCAQEVRESMYDPES